METPSSSTFGSLEYLKELFTTASLERAEIVEDFDDHMPTSIRHLKNVYVLEMDLIWTDENSIPERNLQNLWDYEAFYGLLADGPNDINAEMRASFINLLVRVSYVYIIQESNPFQHTVSGLSLFQLQPTVTVAWTCLMMIAWKYVSPKSAPKVPVWCHVTGKIYWKDEDHLLQLKCLASYILQLSLLDYVVLQYAPQLVAASAGFLARFILSPSDKPWDAKLREYTLYQPSDLEECIKLEECVKALHRLYRNEGGASLSAIAAKYSQSKYCSVSKRECKATIPEQLFWAV
ncbi:hypothetical protein F3Y22_tig00110562pilonHSYRG00067 [Hibiscus syriacus]|uniref:Cyclin C-terminal domain-containing protein n=1 Tax=Hibiscus syriacus TaxID=106335 RepID=A0A6A3A812_HIBSY|nr:hypothetical protein F3Y22_tig00110562pilonHSYRG00067 [Hibiscus syriacus]